MKVILTVLLVISIFLCVMNVNTSTGRGEFFRFDIQEFIEWFHDNIDSSPTIFSDWEAETDSFWDNFLGGLADIGMLLTFPIRFVFWLIPVVIDFVSTYLLPGVSF